MKIMELNAKRILIIKPSSLGDIVHTLPVVHALKRCCPSCVTGWVIQKNFAPIIEHDPAVDHIYPIHIPSTSDPHASRFAYLHALLATVHTLKDLRRQFHAQPYDLILDLHASFRSGLFGMMNPGGVKIGFENARELNTWFQHQTISQPVSVVHALEKNLLFPSYLGCPVQDEDFFLGRNKSDDCTIDALLEDAGCTANDTLIYVNPAARWATKFWIAERWASFADRLITEHRYKVIFAGSGQDQSYIASITQCMHSKALNVAGTVNLGEAVALLKRSHIYVGLDSGPMHMAAMAGIPTVALFGPTNPELVGPYGVEHHIIQAPDCACLGCRKRECSSRDCMQGITVDHVYTATMDLLESKKICSENRLMREV